MNRKTVDYLNDFTKAILQLQQLNRKIDRLDRAVTQHWNKLIPLPPTHIKFKRGEK